MPSAPCAGGRCWYDERNKAGDIDEVLAAVSGTELARHILAEHVRYEAMNYQNKAIREMTGY